MTKNILLFLATFVAGAVVALVARTAMFKPEAVMAATSTGAEHGAMVATAAGAKPAEATGSAAKPVNTVCAICGMEVDPKLPTLEYQGKRIGFGCRLCPPKFQAEPDRYGPFYLRNEVIKK